MKLRIQYMYENGNVSFADSIMTSKRRIPAVKPCRVCQPDCYLRPENVKRVSGYKEKVNQKEQDLETEHSNLLELQDSTEAKQASVKELMSSKQKELTSYNSQISSAQSSIDQYDADIKAQENQMKAIEAEMKAGKKKPERKQKPRKRRIR